MFATMKATKNTPVSAVSAKTINTAELKAVLADLKGCVMLNLTTLTDAKLNKRGNPLANCIVRKLQTKVCQFGYSYENAVNNRLEKQGDERTFVAESLPYGTWEIPNKFIAHNGTTYVRFYLLKGAEPTTIYMVNGAIANKAQMEIIRQFEPKHAPSNTQSAEGLNVNQVKPFNVRIDNIVSLSVNGTTYSIAE